MIPSEIKAAAWAFLLDTLLRFFSIRVAQSLPALPYLPPHLLLGPSYAHSHSRNVIPEDLVPFQPSSTATSLPIISHDPPTITSTPLSPILVLDPLAEPSDTFWFHSPPPGAPHPSQKRMHNVIFPSWVRPQAPAPGEKQDKAIAPFSPRIITFCPVLLLVRYALTLSTAYLMLSVLAMLVAAPLEQSSEAVICDVLLVNLGVVSPMRGIYKMLESGITAARYIAVLPKAALRRSWPIIKKAATSAFGYCLCTGTSAIACLRKVAHLTSSAIPHTTVLIATARRWPLFILHQLYTLLVACLRGIATGIKPIYHFAQRKPAKMVQIPTITITPAEHEEPSSRESVNIGALLEEISEGTAGLGSLLGHASLSSDDCSEHGVADEPRTDDLLLDVSCGQVDDEEEFLGAGGQELHVKCQDHEIRLDAPDPTLPDAIASEPEIHDICSRDFVEGAIKLKSPVTYPPLVPSGEDEEIASIPHKAGYPIDHLTPKESAPGGQPILSEGDAHQKTIPGSTVLRALKWEGIYDNQNVLNLGVVIDVPEPKAPSRCPGTTSSMDESPGDLHRAVQLPLPDSLQATVKIRSSLAPSHSEASGPLSSVQGEDERRVDSLTVLPQENSPDKTCFAPDNEIFMPEGAMETEKSAFVPFVPPSSAPWKKYVNRDSGFPTTMPEASIPRKIPSAEVFLQNVQPSTAPNSKGCPSGVKEGSTKITTYDKLYSVSNSDLAGQESTSKIWDFPKSRTNAPFHRLLSASIHAPSGQPSEPIHHIDVWGATESIPAMSQSRRPPHVVLSKNCPDHRAASFIPQGSATKSALTRSGPPLRLAGRSLEQGDCALNVNFPDPTQSREYMADQCDPIARAHGLPPLRSAGTYATHGSVPPRTVSGANHITAHRDPSTREPIPDWAAEAAAERRSAVIPPNVSLGTSATRVSSLHQPTGTTTLHTPIPRDVMTTGSKHVSSKVTRWAAEVSRVREPAASHILEGSSLDPGEGVQQRPPLLNRKSKTSLSLDDTPAIFPSTTGAAYHGQRSEPSEFAKQKRVAETRRREQTKIFEGQDSSYYEPGCAKMWEDILLEARRMNGDMWRSPSNATVSDFSLSEWFSRGKDPISGEDIERMIHMLQGGHER